MYHHFHQSISIFIFLIHSNSCWDGSNYHITNPDKYRACRFVTYTSRRLCATLYEKEGCDGQKCGLPDTKGAKFPLPSSCIKPQSLSVRMGCALQVFTGKNCQGNKFLFIAPENRKKLNYPNFAVKTLDDSITEKFCTYIH